MAPMEDTPTPWAMLVRAADADPRWPTNTIALEPDHQPQSWNLVYTVLSPGAQVREPLACVWREGSDLRFTWLVPPNSALGPAQLANCLVEVRAGTQRRVLQLRQPQTLQPLVLELHRPRQVIPVAMPHPPRPERMCLEVVALEEFPGQPQFRGGIRVATATLSSKSPTPIASPLTPRPPMAIVPVPALPPGMVPAVPGVPGSVAPTGAEKLVIEWAEYPGVEIRLSLSAAAPERPEVWVEAVYRDPAESEFPLTLAELDGQEAEAKKTLTSAEAALAKARSTIKRLQERDEKLQKNKPTVKRNQELTEVQRQIALSSAEEAKLAKQVESAKAIIELGDKLRSLIKQLDNRAKIQFVLYLESGDADLLLSTNVKTP